MKTLTAYGQIDGKWYTLSVDAASLRFTKLHGPVNSEAELRSQEAIHEELRQADKAYKATRRNSKDEDAALERLRKAEQAVQRLKRANKNNLLRDRRPLERVYQLWDSKELSGPHFFRVVSVNVRLILEVDGIEDPDAKLAAIWVGEREDDRMPLYLCWQDKFYFHPYMGAGSSRANFKDKRSVRFDVADLIQLDLQPDGSRPSFHSEIATVTRFATDASHLI